MVRPVRIENWDETLKAGSSGNAMDTLRGLTCGSSPPPFCTNWYRNLGLRRQGFLTSWYEIIFAQQPTHVAITKRSSAAQTKILYRVIKNVAGVISSGAGPHHEARIDKAIELLAARAGPGLNADTLDDRVQEVGQ